MAARRTDGGFSMSDANLDRRILLELMAATGGFLLLPSATNAQTAIGSKPNAPIAGKADHVIRIATGLAELAPDKIISTTMYNGQLPGPLLRLEEGRKVTIDVHNDTDTPELLHWHGQFVSPQVDGAAEEGTPFIPPHGMHRLSFTPGPSGLRFYHTHARAMNNLDAGQYSGQLGAVYIAPKHEPGSYDQEVFLVLKEFLPSFSKGGDMAMEFLSPSATDPALKGRGEAAMNASLAKGVPHGYEVGYQLFGINGRMLGHGDPIRVKAGQRVMFHIVNGSATEIRSLALPGHTFKVVALDGNPVPTPVDVPVLWIGTAERVSAIVEMNHPGVWVLGDLSDDRENGMGTVLEYAGHTGKPLWQKPEPFLWDYTRFSRHGAAARKPDEVFEMTFAKDNAAFGGFNRWTINGTAFDMTNMKPMFHLHRGHRYRLRMHNASDDIHPVHLHRHSFEITSIAGKSTAGVIKDVAMLGGYQTMEVDFVADNPGLTLFHCHMQLHMDYGFMCLFDYV